MTLGGWFEGPGGSGVDRFQSTPQWVGDLTSAASIRCLPSPFPLPPSPLSPALQNVQSFLSNMMGGSWQDFVPDSWALPSFDWSKMGEFGEWGWVAVVD